MMGKKSSRSVKQAQNIITPNPESSFIIFNCSFLLAFINFKQFLQSWSCTNKACKNYLKFMKASKNEQKKIMKDDSGLGVMMFCACTGQFVFYVIVLL